MKKTKKSNRGGDRGGRKPLKYGEPAKRKTFQYPASKEREFLQAVEAILKKWEVNPKQ